MKHHTQSATLWRDELEFENFLALIDLIEKRDSSTDHDLDRFRFSEIKRHLKALIKRRQVQRMHSLNIEKVETVRLKIIKDLSELDDQ